MAHSTPTDQKPSNAPIFFHSSAGHAAAVRPTARCHGGDEDSGGNSDGEGTGNNQQSTKNGGGNGNGNGNDDKDNNK